MGTHVFLVTGSKNCFFWRVVHVHVCPYTAFSSCISLFSCPSFSSFCLCTYSLARSFGADRIFNSAGRLPTEAEIDAIIDRSVRSDKNADASGAEKDKLETWEMTTNDAKADSQEASSSSSAFSKGTQNTADFEMTAQASLKLFQGVEYHASAVAQTTEDIAAAFHQSGAGAAMLSRHLKTNLVGGNGGAAAGMPRERKSR